MFGRFRPPPSSPDCLERCPAKLIKDDPLSVYESTLLKLKKGSKLDLGPCRVTSSDTESENESPPDAVVRSDPSTSSDTRNSDLKLLQCLDPMAIDSGSGGGESGGSPKQQKNVNPSVLGMFCRYRNLVRERSMPHEEDISLRTENSL